MDAEIVGTNSQLTSSNIRLEGVNNWPTWKFQLKVILKAINVYGVIDGSYKCPEGDDKHKWLQADAKAQGVLVTRMSPSVIILIQNCETAEEMWKKLSTIYEQNSDVSLHLIQQKFFEIKLCDTENVTTFIARIEDLVARIKQAQGTMSDSMVITKIISSLGENYRHFISAWDSVPSSHKTLAELTARLIIEEQRNKQSEESSTAAFKVQSAPRKCFKCGKTGHVKADCKFKYSSVKIYCNKCKKHGHKIENCWFNKEKLEPRDNKNVN